MIVRVITHLIVINAVKMVLIAHVSLLTCVILVKTIVSKKLFQKKEKTQLKTILLTTLNKFTKVVYMKLKTRATIEKPLNKKGLFVITNKEGDRYEQRKFKRIQL